MVGPRRGSRGSDACGEQRPVRDRVRGDVTTEQRRHHVRVVRLRERGVRGEAHLDRRPPRRGRRRIRPWLRWHGVCGDRPQRVPLDEVVHRPAERRARQQGRALLGGAVERKGHRVVVVVEALTLGFPPVLTQERFAHIGLLLGAIGRWRRPKHVRAIPERRHRPCDRHTAAPRGCGWWRAA